MDTHTTVVMVAIVAAAKISVTIASNHQLPAAAGYITRGISGSQGPKRNIVNRTQGVRDRRIRESERDSLE